MRGEECDCGCGHGNTMCHYCIRTCGKNGKILARPRSISEIRCYEQ